MPCCVMLTPFCKVTEYCSLSGTDLLMDVPSLLCSWAGSTRASIAVLSQIEPAPGAVIAAQAVPEDCGTAPPFAAFSATSSDIVVGSRATVMSAPTRVSQNGETACFTDTAEAPFGLPLPDQVVSLPSAARRAVDPFAASPLLSVDASMLSWLQSRLLMSMPDMSTSVSAAEPDSAGCVAKPSWEPACELSCGQGACARTGVASPASKPK